MAQLYLHPYQNLNHAERSETTSTVELLNADIGTTKDSTNKMEADEGDRADSDEEGTSSKEDADEEGDIEANTLQFDCPAENDYSDEPQNSGSNLAFQIEPSTGWLLDDWYELDEIDPMDLDGIPDEIELNEGHISPMMDSDNENNWDSD